MTAPYLSVPVFSWPAAPGGLLYTYAPGGVSAKTTYGEDGTTPNTNPVVLDTTGTAIVRGEGLYHFLLKDSTGTTTLWDADYYQTSTTYYSQTAAEILASVTPSDFSYPPGDVRRYGALGDGTTDDTTAVNAALSINQSVLFPTGFIFICGPLTASVAGQSISGYGATVRFKTGSTNGQMSVTGAGVSILGVTFDFNSVAQNGVVVRSQDVTIRDCTFAGAGTTGAGCIYGTNNLAGTAGPDRLKILSNRIISGTATQYGIYVESTVADCFGVQIVGNYIDMTPNTTNGTGIYLTGQNSPYTYKQQKWEITGNIVIGTVIAPTGIGIVTRAWYGICSNNVVTGFTMCISMDFSERSVISGNRLDLPSGATSYCLEINGSYNTIIGNNMNGGKYSISSSNGNAAIGYNVYSGNIFREPSLAGIYFNGAATSVQQCDITGNQFIFTTTGRNAIYLQADCRYTLISGNKFFGPGSGVASGRGVFIAPTAGVTTYDVAILGNSFSGWERPVAIYNANNIAAQRVQFNGNDCSNDMTSSTGWLSLEGFPPTYGTGITQLNNTRSTIPSANYVDRANNIIDSYGTGTPEAAVTAGVGSTFHRTDGGAGTSLYVKESGTGNVGWVGK
jgi:hypothetical protein